MALIAVKDGWFATLLAIPDISASLKTFHIHTCRHDFLYGLSRLGLQIFVFDYPNKLIVQVHMQSTSMNSMKGDGKNRSPALQIRPILFRCTTYVIREHTAFPRMTMVPSTIPPLASLWSQLVFRCLHAINTRVSSIWTRFQYIHAFQRFHIATHMPMYIKSS